MARPGKYRQHQQSLYTLFEYEICSKFIVITVSICICLYISDSGWLSQYSSTGGNSTWNACRENRLSPCACEEEFSHLQVVCGTRIFTSDDDDNDGGGSQFAIRKLALTGLGMVGTLPASLSALTHLETFLIDCNELHGRLPKLQYYQIENGCKVVIFTAVISKFKMQANFAICLPGRQRPLGSRPWGG